MIQLRQLRNDTLTNMKERVIKVSKLEYVKMVKNASKFRKGFLLLGKDLHKYTRIGILHNGNVSLYNHWLDLDIEYTASEFEYIQKNIPSGRGYNRFAR